MSGHYHVKMPLKDFLKMLLTGQLPKGLIGQAPKRTFGGPLPMFTGPKTAKKAAQRLDWDRWDKSLTAAAYSTNPTIENLNALLEAALTKPSQRL